MAAMLRLIDILLPRLGPLGTQARGRLAYRMLLELAVLTQVSTRR